MIRSFRHKGLAQLFIKNNPSKIKPELVKRCRERLRALHAASQPEEMNIPGFNFHSLEGNPKR